MISQTRRNYGINEMISSNCIKDGPIGLAVGNIPWESYRGFYNNAAKMVVSPRGRE
jgi:hypothetical protein